MALASAKRVSEINAISKDFSNNEDWTEVQLEPVTSFVAKTQDPSKDDRRFGAYKIPSIPVDEKGRRSKLCPVRCLKTYWKRIKHLRRPYKKLFVNPDDSKRPISKNTISFWLRELIYRAHKRHDRKIAGRVKAHSIRSISASLNFTYNRSLYQVLKAGSWTKHNTFTKHCLKGLSLQKMEKFTLELGPVVAAQSIVGGPSSSKK